jgi:hypothetical protein
MKNIDFTTGEVTEIETPENTEQQPQETKKELSNREIQYQRLATASAAAREIKEGFIQNAKTDNQALFYASKPLNYYILNYIYTSDEITEFKKFNEWKSEGATVKKGEKAYPIWGQPVAKQLQNEAEQKGEQYEPTDEEERRFPMCYVFSNLQVSFRNQPQSVEV